MSKVSTVVPVADASLGSLPPQNREPAREPPPAAAHDQADLRLIIEEDEKTGAFVYKTMDSRTGQIIQQFPREEMLRLQQDQEYVAGVLVNTRA